ncbi:MAG TPA: FMN-binding protein [Streptosporangiaceae bacterium]|nr:FMN-binding protein [Streptosporangiaceae bacterium]
MKRASWYLVAGVVAGFAGVLALHSRGAPAARSAAAGSSQPGQSARPSTGPSASSRPSQRAVAGGAARSAAGALEQYGYGELAVRVTVSGNRITDVTVPALKTNDPTSQQIADQAIPELKSQVLAADSAGIDGVSGATFTSRAYEQSVQAALDKLHAS